MTDPLEAIKDEIQSRQGQYDVLIVMSHVGVFLMNNYVKKYQILMLFSGAIRITILNMVK